MFTLIKDFFENVWNGFTFIAEFCEHLLKSIFTVFESVWKSLQFIYSLASGNYFPSIFVGFFAVTALIFIVYMIINRDPGD